MRDELYEVLTAITLDTDIEGILLKGTGSKGFCGGADLTEFGTAPSQHIARNIRKERDLWEVFMTLPIPIVCILHGYTFGSGVEIAMLCDVRIATENTIISLPETGLGIIPAAGGTQTIPRQIGLGHSLDLLLLGKQIEVDKGTTKKIPESGAPLKMNVPEPKGELSTPTKSLKALPPNEDSAEEAKKEIAKSLDNTAKKEALVQTKNAPIEKVIIEPTK